MDLEYYYLLTQEFIAYKYRLTQVSEISCFIELYNLLNSDYFIYFYDKIYRLFILQASTSSYSTNGVPPMTTMPVPSSAMSLHSSMQPPNTSLPHSSMPPPNTSLPHSSMPPPSGTFEHPSSYYSRPQQQVTITN